MTQEQRERMNAEGNSRGCMQCPECGDSVLWKPFQEVVVGQIEIPVEVDGVIRSGGLAQYAMSAVCVECWPKMSTDKRVAAFASLFDKRRAAIRSPRRRHTGTAFIPDAEDQKRYDAECAALDAEFQAIQDAVARG